MDSAAIFTDYIVPIAAVIGLGLSIYNTYRNWKEFRRNISLGFSYIDKYFEPSLPGEISLNCYVLLVKNLGKINIIIDVAGFKWKNGKVLLKPPNSLSLSPVSGAREVMLHSLFLPPSGGRISVG